MTRIDVINFLISKYNFKKYLEIGVRRPEDCFSHILCDYKDGVDPGIENTSNPVKYQFTSDDFFFRLDNNQLEIPSDFKYDIIFIDGLHISHQVEKDILNSLNHLSEGGVIILHDCNPFMHGYDYLRVIEDRIEYVWNGTVWKAIYKLKATRTDLKIGTLNLDEGLGIITRGEQELIPFDNPYFEYRKFNEDLKRNLGLMEFNELEHWLDNKKNKISIVISYCSLDKRFIETNITESLKISDDVVVSTYDHLFNGEPEDLSFVEELKNKYPMVKFIISKWTDFIDHPRYWHNMGRLLGYEKTNKDYKWLIFLDGDEILDSYYFNLLLQDPKLNDMDAYIMKVDWFYREPIYKSTTQENNIPFYKKSIVSINPFDPIEERGQVCRKTNELFSGVTYNGNVIINHYSWVRTKEEMLKKVSSWGHKNDTDWVKLIEEEFSRDFNGTDCFKGYQYETVEDVYKLGVFTKNE